MCGALEYTNMESRKNTEDRVCIVSYEIREIHTRDNINSRK
jgi:hypothetical protein